MKNTFFTSKRLFTGIICIVTIISMLIFAGCESAIEDGTYVSETSLELTFAPDGITSTEGISKSITGGSGSIVANATNVPVEANVSVAFDTDINVSTINTSTFNPSRVFSFVDQTVNIRKLFQGNQISIMTQANRQLCIIMDGRTVQQKMKILEMTMHSFLILQQLGLAML